MLQKKQLLCTHMQDAAKHGDLLNVPRVRLRLRAHIRIVATTCRDSLTVHTERGIAELQHTRGVRTRRGGEPDPHSAVVPHPIKVRRIVVMHLQDERCVALKRQPNVTRKVLIQSSAADPHRQCDVSSAIILRVSVENEMMNVPR